MLETSTSDQNICLTSSKITDSLSSIIDLGAKVSSYNWGLYEPGEVGECVVMDSQIRWLWNAIGCVISAYVTCHGHPVWCPSPSLASGVTFLNDQENQEIFPDGSNLFLTCQEGYHSNPKQVSIHCQNGFWSDYSLSCTPFDCGKLIDDKYQIEYLNESTLMESIAKVTCRENNLSKYSFKTCKQV